MTRCPFANLEINSYNSSNTSISNKADIRSLPSGTYHLEITDINGCKIQSRPYTIDAVTATLPAPRYDAVTIPRHADAELRVKNYMPGGVYELYDAATGSLIERNSSGVFILSNVPENTDYIIKLVAGVCGSEPGMVSIKVIDITRVEVPNAFTPNGDGINDEFRIKITGWFRLNNLRIFNRYGQMIFETRDLSREWKGYFNSNPVAVGTYYWTLEGIDIHGSILRKSGSVTVIR